VQTAGYGMLFAVFELAPENGHRSTAQADCSARKLTLGRNNPFTSAHWGQTGWKAALPRRTWVSSWTTN